MKAGYGEPLRALFAGKAWVESVVDFGHAKQIFPDADVFPSIIVVRRPDGSEAAPETTKVCAIPREQLRIEDLSVQIAKEGVEVERSRLSRGTWQLETSSVVHLLAKIRGGGVALTSYSGTKPYYGIKTGLNEAFIIDTQTRNTLLDVDPLSSEIIRPYLRGQDIQRWSPEWAGNWMIFARRGIEIDAYPAVRDYLASYRERLEPKPRDWTGSDWRGRKAGTYKWYEVQDAVDYWEHFGRPKIVYQDITWRPSFCFDALGTLTNDTTFFIPSSDFWLLACLNSPLSWWYAWRIAYHGKDDALRLKNIFMEDFPIPTAGPDTRSICDSLVSKLIELTKSQQTVRVDLLDWLRIEHAIAEPNQKLQSALDLDSDAFISEVRKLRGKKNPLSLAALKSLREEHTRTILPAQALAREALALERTISDLVNEAYGLTPEEEALMWETAPPRMPIRRS